MNREAWLDTWKRGWIPQLGWSLGRGGGDLSQAGHRVEGVNRAGTLGEGWQ